MGNKHSKELDEFEKNYQYLEQQKDPRYDSVKFYHRKDNVNDLLLLKDRWTNSPEDS